MSYQAHLLQEFGEFVKARGNVYVEQRIGRHGQEGKSSKLSIHLREALIQARGL